MKINQHPYCSPKAMLQRKLNRTPPWGVDVCEVDDLYGLPPDDPLYPEWQKAKRLRDEIEAGGAA